MENYYHNQNKWIIWKSKKPAMRFDENAISIANGVGDLSDLT